ncbi:MAG: histidinol-phosphatase [Saprospiraceae bacterium]|nr:histidinol-phosphatase [Lewinella sp.]
MQLANHHAHSHFSDGRLTPEDYLKNAIDQHLLLYGFADHAPVPIDNFGAMTMKQLEGYLMEVDRLKERYGQQIQIYKSLEVDYIPGVINVHSPHIQAADLDYTVGAVHFVDRFADGRPWGFEASHENFQKGVEEIFEGDIRIAINRYYTMIREMITTHCPDVIAHLDRIKKLNKGDRYFSEDAEWYRQEVLETLVLIAGSGAVMEVNTKGFYKGEIEDTYPGKWVLQVARELNIPVHLSSDAHHPDDITKGFEYAGSLLKSISYRTTRIFLDGSWQEVELEPSAIYTS